MASFRAMLTPSRMKVALAGGAALTAYVAHQTRKPIAASEPAASDNIYVING